MSVMPTDHHIQGSIHSGAPFFDLYHDIQYCSAKSCTGRKKVVPLQPKKIQ